MRHYIVAALLVVVVAAPVSALAQSSKTSNENDADFRLVPGGKRLHKDCVHEVPDNATIDEHRDVFVDGVFVEHIATCNHEPKSAMPGDPFGSRWMIWGEKEAQPEVGLGWFNSIASTWNVPSFPRIPTSAELIFLFPSLQATNFSSIMQPVLQWGNSAAGGGLFWAMGNWLVYDDGTALHTGLQVVFPGNIIAGYITQDPLMPCNSLGIGCGWAIEYRVNGGALHTMRTVADGPYLFAESGVLEIWFVEACAQLPAPQPPGPTTSVSFTVTSLTQARDWVNGQPRSIAVPKNFVKCPGPTCPVDTTIYSPQCGYNFVNMADSGMTFLFWNSY